MLHIRDLRAGEPVEAEEVLGGLFEHATLPFYIRRRRRGFTGDVLPIIREIQAAGAASKKPTRSGLTFRLFLTAIAVAQ
jgi:hypothetical protein